MSSLVLKAVQPFLGCLSVSATLSGHSLLDGISKVPLQCSFLENPSGVTLGRFNPQYLFLISLKLHASSPAPHTSSEVHTDQMACKASRNAQRWSPNFSMPVVTKGAERQPHLFQLLHLCGESGTKLNKWGRKWVPKGVTQFPD